MTCADRLYQSMILIYVVEFGKVYINNNNNNNNNNNIIIIAILIIMGTKCLTTLL